MNKNSSPEDELYESLRRGTKTTEIEELEKISLKQKFDVNFSKKGWTLLHAAVKRNNVGLVKWLLTKGADINPLNIYGVPMPGCSPIDVATSNGLAEIVQILLDYDAKINPMMLFLAIWNKETEVARVILKHGSHILDTDCDNAEEHRQYYTVKTFFHFGRYTI